MRIRAAGRITSACRGQCDGVRVERADGENAHRQSERNHPMREHGSRWQQSGLRRLALLSDPMIVFRNPDVPITMAVHRLVRSGDLWRFEHHHGQGWFDFRGPVFVPKHRERRQLHCLAVQSGRETLQNGRSWMRRERARHHV